MFGRKEARYFRPIIEARAFVAEFLMKEIINKRIEKQLKEVTSNLEIPEIRDEQLIMSQNLCRFLNYAENPGLGYLIEAGTGVGKSFAYLIALFEHLKNNTEDREKAIIATNTINLQEQLLNKDIPAVQKFYPDLKVEKAKGRNNYVCLRQLKGTYEGNLFINDEADEVFVKIETWLDRDNGSGDRADVPFKVDNDTWHEISSSAESCHGNNCPFNNKCYYNKAIRKIQRADVIIANHALILTDIKNSFLPNYTYLIIDEAHNFEKNALKAFTVEINKYRFNRIIKKLKNSYCQAGLRRAKKIEVLEKWFYNIELLADNFLNGLPDGRIYEKPDFIHGEKLLNELYQISTILQSTITKNETTIIKVELEKAVDEIAVLALDIEQFLMFNSENNVYWCKNKKACYAPITTSFLQNFWKGKTSVLTSATLTVADSFTNIVMNLNLDKKNIFTLKLDSPFDYKNNAVVYLPSFAISPKEEEYTDYLIQVIPDIVQQTNGKTFVLFTSFSLLNEVFDAVKSKLQNYMLLKQEKGNRDIILKKFRENGNTVLFGTDSFWEGVDEDINCVIITKLPFAVPTEPIEEAQYEKLKREGKNPFFLKAIPNCALKLKQGTGRLIRNSQKKGVIAILDPRIKASWGNTIVKTLPEMQWINNINKVDNFFNKKIS